MTEQQTTSAVNLISHIRSVYPSLTKTEKKIAAAVLDEPMVVMYASITDLAEKASVGETSVLRFCRSVNYRGFQDFKIALAQSVTSELESASLSFDNRMEELTEKNKRLLQDTANLLSESELDHAANLLLNGKKILFFGVGSSGATAQNAHFRFLRLGLPVEVVTDGHLGTVKASLLSKEDVIVVVSVSGSTVDSVDVAQAANENGAKVIVMTSHAKSPATKFADVLLLSASREKPTEGSAFSSIIAQLHILEILFDSILSKMGKRGKESMEITAKASSRKLY
ncbi:MurR/RpiR family transcriptional regulator [Bacillus sp. 1P10SD]|uniref:MurR/RpiR family transcriptional regulator n=1 Tax=Bacillus sp. 1P10SD TaxID=3132265 RepID=UPI0039A76987